MWGLRGRLSRRSLLAESIPVILESGKFGAVIDTGVIARPNTFKMDPIFLDVPIFGCKSSAPLL